MMKLRNSGHGLYKTELFYQDNCKKIILIFRNNFFLKLDGKVAKKISKMISMA